MRNEMNARLRDQANQFKTKIDELQDQLELKNQDRLELTSGKSIQIMPLIVLLSAVWQKKKKDMSRQYKTMQSEMVSKINNLENQMAELKSTLGKKISMVWIH